jgi:hypothetical protein
MPTITLKAHFDGERIQLDEPFELQADTKLMVTLLPDRQGANGNSDYWTEIALTGLARAYSDEEPEYSIDDLKA